MRGSMSEQRSRRLRFGLRSVLLAVAACAVLLGFSRKYHWFCETGHRVVYVVPEDKSDEDRPHGCYCALHVVYHAKNSLFGWVEDDAFAIEMWRNHEPRCSWPNEQGGQIVRLWQSSKPEDLSSWISSNLIFAQNVAKSEIPYQSNWDKSFGVLEQFAAEVDSRQWSKNRLISWMNANGSIR